MNTPDRIRELVSLLNLWRDEYYNQAAPSVSDTLYDKTFDQLLSLEESSGIILTNSPTQTVGYEIMGSLSKVEHRTPLLSLDKTKDVERIVKFADAKDIVAMLKLDGLTIELEYMNGKLIRGSTRGDGHIGEDITHNVSAFKNVPLYIPCLGNIRIVGEALIHYNDFEKINSRFSEENRYRNPRNLASGSIRQLNSKECVDRELCFYAYTILDDSSGEKAEDLRLLNIMGFNVVPYAFISSRTTQSYIENIIDSLTNTATTNSIPIDGIVFAYNDMIYGKSLGETSHHPLHSIAFKFEDETAETTLREVEWSMGRTGQLTPVAIFDTVELDGTEVSRASLHNISILKLLKLGIGDTISVAKMNMIIPQIVENLTESDSLNIPETCPICNGQTVVSKDNESEILLCENPECGGKLLSSLIFFCSKRAMDIEGLSEATLEAFIGQGWIKRPVDIYRLNEHREEIVVLPGFGEKSYQKIWTAIEKSRNVKLENFIVSIGIPFIGITASKAISRRFNGDWNAFIAAVDSGFNFTEIEDFGPIMHKNIVDWSTDRTIAEEVLPFITFVGTTIKETAPENPFMGKTIVVTGSLENFTRTTIQSKIESLGAKSGSSVSKNTDYLLAGDKAGSKLTKAKDLGVRILTEAKFISMIE